VSEGFARTELDGLVALSERMPGLRSVAIGVWVRAGSVDERPEEMGVSHLLEHMVFKGTTTRSARDIALVLERVGGSLDAYTTREHTGYHARVLDDYFDLALDVLADLVLRPLLRTEDLELEREVVLEEISTVEDTPDDLIFDLHARQIWGEHPYGYTVLGTRESVASLTSEALRRAHTEGYRRSNLIIAAVGNVEHSRFVDRVATLFERAGASSSRNGVRLPPPQTMPVVRAAVPRAAAQTHIVMGSQTFGHADPRRYALVLLSNALGGGMSSRLFQRVREELGLAYSVYSYQSFYKLGGAAGVYVGTRPEWADRAQATVENELERLAREGLTQDELEDVKGQVKGQLVLSLESTGARLHRLAVTSLFDEPFRTVERVIAEVDAVTLEDVAALSAELLAPDRQSVMRLGPMAGAGTDMDTLIEAEP
jgi:predicted Zn-dependent peptidase